MKLLFFERTHFGFIAAHGNTALHFAAAYGKVDAIKRLTERGADVNRKDRSGGIPLHIAAPQGEGVVSIEVSGIDRSASQAGAKNVKANITSQRAITRISNDTMSL